MKERDRYVGLVRIIQMVELLRREPWTVDEMADELGVSRRTTLRYFAIIKRTGVFDLKTTYEWPTPKRYRIHSEAA